MSREIKDPKPISVPASSVDVKGTSCNVLNELLNNSPSSCFDDPAIVDGSWDYQLGKGHEIANEHANSISNNSLPFYPEANNGYNPHHFNYGEYMPYDYGYVPYDSNSNQWCYDEAPIVEDTDIHVVPIADEVSGTIINPVEPKTPVNAQLPGGMVDVKEDVERILQNDIEIERCKNKLDDIDTLMEQIEKDKNKINTDLDVLVDNSLPILELEVEEPEEEKKVIEEEIIPEFKCSWTLWNYKQEKGKQWRNCLNEKCSFVDFKVYQETTKTMETIDKLPVGCDYMLFRTGIEPMWEDERNQNGGRWLFQFDRLIYAKEPEKINKMWKDTILHMMRDGFCACDDLNGINGAVVQSRNKSIKLALWMGNAKINLATAAIGQQWPSMLDVQPELITFEMLNDQQKYSATPQRPQVAAVAAAAAAAAGLFRPLVFQNVQLNNLQTILKNNRLNNLTQRPNPQPSLLNTPLLNPLLSNILTANTQNTSLLNNPLYLNNLTNMLLNNNNDGNYMNNLNSTISTLTNLVSAKHANHIDESTPNTNADQLGDRGCGGDACDDSKGKIESIVDNIRNSTAATSNVHSREGDMTSAT
ncbi:hypothetical protein SNEBB_007262 [Seison nebaliae]|nr:hypothetical protein SNEBB_007262 [Seison nebaliae]